MSSNAEEIRTRRLAIEAKLQTAQQTYLNFMEGQREAQSIAREAFDEALDSVSADLEALRSEEETSLRASA